MTAWAHHPADWREWYGSTARYATDQYAQLLATVDPRTISATRVLGRLRLTDTGTAHTEVAVRTDAGMVSVVLVPATGNSGGWQVQDLRPGAQAVD
ncbi:hypothetical protein [Streptomyces crystallinus]|uniref:hypothetical protein n=1 Tax=Streptomyces crystallinus TaxID=68191 RepID=UPI0031DA5778